MVLGTDPSSVKDGHTHCLPSVAGLAISFWNSGIALIATAAFLFSCTSLAVKLLGDDVPTFQVVLVPGIICFVATSLVVRLTGTSVRSRSWRVAGLTLLRGLLGATSITCFYLAIELLPLQDAVTLFFCSPVVAILLELLVTGESQGCAAAAATACTVAGVVLVSQPPCVFSPHHHQHMLHPGGSSSSSSSHVHALSSGTGPGTSAAGVALATAAAIANAAAFVVVRMIRQSQSTLVLTWWYHGVVVAVSAIPLAVGYPAPPVLPDRRGCLLLAVVGLTQLLGQLLLNRGFQLESATRGSAINVLQVLFSFVWDVAVLGDKPGIVSVAGSSLVAAGVLCVTLTGPRPSGSAGEAQRRHPHADGDLLDNAESGIVPADGEEQPLVWTNSGADAESVATAAAEAGGGRAGSGPDVVMDGRASTAAQLRQPLLG